MLNAPSTVFFDHSRHTLWVCELDATLDVLTFTGTERLSEPFSYKIEFTSPNQDIAPEQILNRNASFRLYAPPKPYEKPFPGFPEPEIKPLRTLHGVITGFQRLSASRDEARYAVTLEPRLARLGRGKQTRIYQYQSVPQIVEKVLRSRHEFLGQDFYFNVVREYPTRLQVMQYDESDLAFITRLLAEVGIWFRFVADNRLRIDVVEFHDDQRHYIWPHMKLPLRPPSGLDSKNQDSVWDLQTSHKVVEQRIHFKAYDPRNISTWLQDEVDQTRGATTTYGEAYHYAEAYTELGGKLDQDEDLLSESGFFYARLRHERYLNERTLFTGVCSSASLSLVNILDIEGAPGAFKDGAVVTCLHLDAARDRSLKISFEAIPYAETICFRPPLQKKPNIGGTLPARVTSNRANDPYGHINLEGRYTVNFLFDRDEWKQGEESLWLRLARPYAGDTHGLHLPLICGTEVAIAFEQGDPDRPYIAHALHDNKHPDHVTLARHDYKRNVLRTPANNKLRMDDERGREHIKLSTEHSGKSQLNLGHLVDAQKQRRGEGFELRTDGWGAIRGGKGLFITAYEQAKATGPTLFMDPSSALMQGAIQQMSDWQPIAHAHHSPQPTLDGLNQLQADTRELSAAALLLSAPKGIAAVTPASLLLKSGNALYLQSQDEINLAAAASLSVHANEAISLLAQEQGLRLVSGKGPLEIESHDDLLNLIAQRDVTVQSAQGQIQVTAKNSITLGCGGGHIRITAQGDIEIHSPGFVTINGKHRLNGPGGETFALPELPGSVRKSCLEEARLIASATSPRRTLA
jgi:type VI secretion system secreted protein VgrG